MAGNLASLQFFVNQLLNFNNPIIATINEIKNELIKIMSDFGSTIRSGINNFSSQHILKFKDCCLYRK